MPTPASSRTPGSPEPRDAAVPTESADGATGVEDLVEDVSIDGMCGVY